MTETFDFNYNRAYTASVQFNTIVDEVFSGKEQRRDVWTNPRRRWILEFEKSKDTITNDNWEQIVNFFIDRKGRKEFFEWTWSTDKGGDGKTYAVRFDTDELNLDIMELGYSKFSIPIVQVIEAGYPINP